MTPLILQCVVFHEDTLTVSEIAPLHLYFSGEEHRRESIHNTDIKLDREQVEELSEYLERWLKDTK